MKKFVFLLLELLAGLLLFCLLLFLGIDKYKEHINSHSSYTITFKDVDGLSVGSPVRLMGTQVGNVTSLELLDSEIYVTFRVSKKSIKIPDNSTASIQFTGLAGSKSLEIMPPNTKFSTSKKVILAEEPIRINSVMQVQTAIFESVLDFCQGMLAFLSKNSIETTKKNLQTTSKYIQETNQDMDEAVKNIQDSGSKISENTKEIQLFLNEQNKNLDSAYKSFDKLTKDQKLKNNMETIQTTVENFSASTDIEKTNQKVSAVTNNLNEFNSNIKKFNQNLSKAKNHEVEYVSQLNKSLQKTTDNLQGFVDSFKKNKSKSSEKNSVDK